MVTRKNSWQDAYATGTALLDLGDGILVPLPTDGVLPGKEGPPGAGVPAGGAAGQVIRRNAAGTATEWASPDKAMVGLSNVDNTADADKPVSVPQAAELVKRVARGDYFIDPKDAAYGAKGDGITDDTAAIAAAVATGKPILFTAGTYVWSRVNVTADLDVYCSPGVVFKRRANADVPSGSAWDVGTAMFEIAAPGLRVHISDYTYDGNNTNQPATEPTGYFLKVTVPAAPTGAPTRVTLTRGRHTNGTSGYLILRGDNNQRRYETTVTLEDCRFHETLYGIGKGDPNTPNPLGYLPTYVLVMDYVKLHTRNFHADWDKTTGLGQYAAVAVNLTYFGTDYALSGEASAYMSGTTYIRGLGRSPKSFDNDTVFTVNNGIGAIDAYGNAETIHIDKLVAVGSRNSSVRAKGSLKSYTVGHATLTNCHRGLQVGPSTTGPCETVVNVESVTVYGGTIPSVDFTGTSATDRLRAVTVGSVNVIGTLTNPEALTDGVLNVRSVEKLSAKAVSVAGAPAKGISTRDVRTTDLRGVNVATAATAGVESVGAEVFTIDGFTISDTGGMGISITGSPVKVDTTRGRLTRTTDYGIFSNNTTSDLTVNAVTVDTVAGLNRAFYVAGGDALFTHNRSNAAAHVYAAAGIYPRQQHNSWNPVETFGTAAPAAGTWKVGDRVYAAAPIAGGKLGWVCTAAGAPGTWKAFGAIDA